MKSVSLLAALLLAAPAYADELGLQRITPSGDNVPAQNQIVLGFDRAVVPLGRMERDADEVPVTVSPATDCQWRWIDTQNLACNLAEGTSLRPATAYTVQIREGFTAVDGSTLPARTHRFSTETPRVQFADVAEWRGPTTPVLRVRFTQPVSAGSVARALNFDGADVTVEPEYYDEATPFYTPDGEARQLWRVLPRVALAADRAVRLRVTPGLQSAFGSAAGREARVVETVQTFAAPQLLGLQCWDGEKARRVTPDVACAPLEGVSLLFNVPVSREALKGLVQLRPTPQAAPAASQATGEDGETPRAAQPVGGNHRAGETYSLPLPYVLAAETDYRVAIAAGLKDRFGRGIGGQGEHAFRTGARTARLVFEHSPAVLEAGVDSEVPVIVTNLERLQTRYRRLDASGLGSEQSREIAVPGVRNIAFAMPLGVRQLLGSSSGAVSGQLQSAPATQSRPQPFFAEVTPWQVHAKYGNSGLLVWVTSLADGKPVAEADVTVLDGFGGDTRASARTDRDGLAELPGSAELDPKLERQYQSLRDDDKQPQALMLRVKRGSDIALLPLSNEFRVDIWRASREQISEWRRERHGHLRSWGATAQGVYRAGDTLQYKLYVRDDSGRSLQAATQAAYTLRIVDPLGNVVQERPGLSLSAFGAIDGELKLASSAAIGWYRFELQPEFASDMTLEPMRVLVSDFVPAPFRVAAELRGAKAEPGASLSAAVRATLHGGGPFANARARLQVRVQSAGLYSEDPLARRFRFDTWQREGRDSAALIDREAALDAKGEWSEPITLADASVLVGDLVLEASVQDDRGRAIVGAAKLPYFGRDRYIGVQDASGWMRAGQPATLQTIVVGTDGKPLRGVPYYVKIERKVSKGARVKGAGNAYITRYSSHWQRIATCQGRSKLDGNDCSFTPDAGGELRAVAMVRDSQDRLHETSNWFYAQGANEVLWEDTPDYSLDIRLDKASYRVGDTARIFVKNPFPGATALITVERYGVLEKRRHTLSGATPVIDLPIKPEYLPGAYVSVVVMSPRVEAPVKDGVDLGKPTFRMGYTTLKIDDPYRELQVQITPSKKQLKPRETVTVNLQAKARHDSGEPVEFAVAVLDEAVFDLIQTGSAYFDPLKGFTQLDPLDLANYSLLTRLVGRQKFEKKGASPGGDGGADLALRSVEKFVAYWNPGLKADAQGRARFTFKTPDNLSGWRVLAMAVTPGDRMGLGQSSIAVVKPTELRAALPNQVARGDSFNAGFTVMNRDKTARTLSVALEVSGAARHRSEQTLSLQPFERRTVYLPVQVEDGGRLRFTARAFDAADRDDLAVELPVRERPLTMTAADFSPLTAEAPLQIPLRLPDDAQRAELRVSFVPTLLGSVGGAFRYMADYPYLCWEQRLSKGVMAAHYLQLRERVSDAPDWPGAAALIPQMLEDAAAFQAPGGGMAFFQPRDEYQSPYLTAYTALAFGWLQQLGHAPPPAVWDRLDAYLQTLLREDISTYGYDSAESRAQVRAMALAALAQRGTLKAEELLRYLPQLPRMGLFGEALYAQAAAKTPLAGAAYVAASDRLLARSQQSAGTLALADDDGAASYAWLLGSRLRGNCAALSAIVAGVDNAELTARLTRAITQARGSKVHWASTQENVFCTRALIDYSMRYESEPLAMTAKAELDGKLLGSVELAADRTAALTRRFDAAGASAARELRVAAQGSGRSYATTTLRYATPPPLAALAAGLTVARKAYVRRADAWQALDGAEPQIRQGETIKVELSLSVPAWMSYVVVDDPVPAGIEPINPDLATASNFSEQDLQMAGPGYPYPFYHRELRFDAVRWYAEDVGAGRYRLAWIGQAVASGSFAWNETHAERMYEPDVFGNGVAGRLKIEAAP